MFLAVMAWAIALLGLFMAVACGLTLLGLARGRLRVDGMWRMETLGLGMLGAGMAGFLWAIPVDDAAMETWRLCWLAVGIGGFFLMLAPQRSQWLRQGARAEGDALFFLRMSTNRNEWRPKHFVVLGIFAAAIYANGAVPQGSWLSWAALIWFFVMLQSLKTLPVHRGRRPPNGLTPGLQP